MSGPNDHYISQPIRHVLRQQAWRVWVAGLVFVFGWVLGIVLPVLIDNAGSIYGFFSYICHQIPERSFHIAGQQLAVCSRCFGVYFGLLVGFATYPLWRSIDSVEPPARLWLFLSLVPIAIDWSLTVFGVWENTQVSRFITGLILGVACATFIVPAIVETARNLSTRRVSV